jgi:hypothetical protein
VERAPEADSSVEAVVALGEAAGALPALAPAAAEAVVVLAVEPPVVADAEMAEASLLGASEEGAWDRDPSHRAAALSPRGAVPRGDASCFGSGPVGPRIPSSFLTMSGRSSLGPLQGRFQDCPGNDFRHTFLVIKAFFVTPHFLPSGSDGFERRQVVVHPPRGRFLGFAAVPEDHAF